MRRYFIRSVAACGIALAFFNEGFAADASAEAMVRLNVVLPASAEEQLALSAAPPHLRSAATVYVFGKRGYERIRVGSNGFTCLVNRDGFFYGASAFKPTCWDRHGAQTYVPVMLKVGEMLAAREPFDAITKAIDAGFANKTFRAPETGGVAYMLAGDVEVNTSTGEVTRQLYPGHYMFYALGATNDQLGFTREAVRSDPTLPSVASVGAGGQHGLTYIISAPAIAAPGHSHSQ